MDEHLAKVWVCSQLTNIAKVGGTSQPNVTPSGRIFMIMLTRAGRR